MSEIAFQVIHQIPGRIRLRLPRLRSNPGDETTLQNQVQSLTAVKAVRVNSKARSLMVQYDSHLVSESNFNTALAAALRSVYPTAAIDLEQAGMRAKAQASRTSAKPSAKHPADIPAQGTLPPDCEVIQLTPYEEIQFAAIEAWKHRRIEKLKEIAGRVLMAAKGLLGFFLVDRVLEKVGSLCESATANWKQDWEKLKPLTGVKEAIDLRHSLLERCDALAERVTHESLRQATAQGSISGLLDVFGEVADEGLTLVLALQTIHRIGLCYGYAPQTPDEQTFAWAIFSAAIALTQEEFEQTQVAIRNLQRSLNRQALENESLEDTLEQDVNDMLIDSAIEEGIAQLSGEAFGGIVPVLSIVMNIYADRDLIESVSTAAKREFQQRWLLENHKIRFPVSESTAAPLQTAL